MSWTRSSSLPQSLRQLCIQVGRIASSSSPAAGVMSAPSSAKGDQSCYVSDSDGAMIIVASRHWGHKTKCSCEAAEAYRAPQLHCGWRLALLRQLESQGLEALGLIIRRQSSTRSSAITAFPAPTESSRHLPKETPRSLLAFCHFFLLCIISDPKSPRLCPAVGLRWVLSHTGCHIL